MGRKSTSKKIRANFENHVGTSVSTTFRSQAQISRQKKEAAALRAMGRELLTPQQLQQMEEARLAMTQGDSTITTDGPDYSDTDAADMEMMNDVLAGRAQLDISHGGGERKRDGRTRKDRTYLHHQGFDPQMPALADAYMEWDWNRSQGIQSNICNEMVDGSVCVKVVDLYREYDTTIQTLSTDKFIAAALIRQGLLPCAPFHPSVVITIPAMQVYHTAHLRCPQFNIQPFVKMLCDLHSVAFRPYLLQQFSICYDLYLDLLNTVHGRVLKALGRDIPNWRALNACPCCTYKLEGEQPLKFAMLGTMDGNDSMKRVEKRESEVIDDDGGTLPGKAIERLDLRNGQGDYFIPRDKVDKWSKEAIGESLVHSRDGNDESPCLDRWQNMINDMSARAWGIFDETGIFVCLCRHGFVLLVADMVRSGELAKYPLAIVDELLNLYGDDIGIGYDVGCKFGITVSRSPLGERACEHRFCALIRLFHGHAHQRRCQLQHLGTYVLGLGLEDLKGCEHYFAGSNALALGVRHASRYHRHQAITNYMRCKDRFDTFQNLSAFLCNNYRQALEILQERPILDDSMRRLGVESESILEGWLKEEEEYLATLSKEPPQETLEMEYYTALLDYYTVQTSVDDAANVWMTVTAETVDRHTHKTETARRHLIERRNNALKIVQVLEACLETRRWEVRCEKWLENEKRVKMRTYQRAIDNLEHLVVSRIFELTKMNMSHTGYKMRKHIGKALQSRSQAIRTALERYNNAARALDPPRAMLRWEQVVEYAFLSDFDLLRDPGTREGIQEISKKVWATPAGRATMDRYFKIKRAEEEIDRLNVEIPRLLTYMEDEDHYLEDQCCRLKESSPALAHQISRYRQDRLRFYDQHHKRFACLSGTAGVTVSLLPGKVLGRRPGWYGPNTSEAPSISDESMPSRTAGDFSIGPDTAIDDAGADDDDRDDTDDQVEEQLIMLMDTFSM
ncbi:hypothetical protein EDD85DRAFT_957591 [Armillaria nabsnona]|nr:hypothetical protein EDD85DRAFT_957591 [Armillaria nabsnona]